MNPLRVDLIHPPLGQSSTVAAQRVLDLRRVVLADENGNLVLGASADDTPTQLAQNVQAYTSQIITQADFTSGVTKSIALTGEPVGMIPIGCYLITTSTVGADDLATTGLTAEVGRAADPDSLMKSVSVYGAAGRKGGHVGAELHSYRDAEALEIKFTAVGAGSENLTHITGLSLRVVMLYIKAPV